ncbi:MAG: hypothetical protein NXI04_02535 [Planctomycetaceae bacterium]|nr:hypothetical protein [Planctomycetaceae bacterium]
MAENPFQTPALDIRAPGATPGRRKSCLVVDAVLCCLPLVSFAYVCPFWLAASCALGRWARPGVDDPSGFLYGIPHMVHMGLMLAAFAVVPVVVARGWLRRRTMAYAMAWVGSAAIAVALYRADVLSIATWIAD